MTPEPGTDASATSMAPEDVRAKLALALDLDDLVEALRLARMLRPWFGVAKVGLDILSYDRPETPRGPLARARGMIRNLLDRRPSDA